MVRLSTLLLGALGLAPTRVLAALEVNLDDNESIKKAASEVAADLLTFYKGDEPGGIPGILPGPPPAGDYYWWLGGAMWGTLLDYRYYTDDKQYDDMIMEAMTFQVGEQKDYMPGNWSASMGNDDQAFWAFAALLAAETGFTDPPESTKLDWLGLAQAVFNEQTRDDRRTQTGNCKNLLRWQAFSFNNGWDYINTISNTCYFNIGARLARYFNNDTLADLTGETYDMLKDQVHYIDDEGNVYDGGHEGKNCEDINKSQFSYNAVLLIQGLAHLTNMSNGDEKWKSKLDFLLPRTMEFFFPNDTAYEWACEQGNTCTVDMLSYKGYLHRWLAATADLVPDTADQIRPVLRKSAQAAVNQCTGGDNGRMCGFKWASGQYDGTTGACQQMSVLSALLSLLPTPSTGTLTNSTGGTSKGDPNAGAELSSHIPSLTEITTGDRAGAGIVTAALLVIGAGTFSWMGIDRM